MALVMAAFVFAARFALVGWGGSPIPQWDQWDGEALSIYKPWLEGHLSLGRLFQPHLEHHIVFTHLLNLALFRAAGQWDPLVQMTASALLSAVIAACLFAGLVRWFDPRWHGVILVGVAGAFASPFGYQDTLWGFQSQFAFLIGLALLAVWGLAQRPPGCFRWWIGLVGAILGPLAMAAGGLVGPAVTLVAVLWWLGDREHRSVARATIVTGLLLSVYGWCARVEAPSMQSFQVSGFAQFSAVLLSALAWPNPQNIVFAPVAFLPCAALTWLVTSGRKRPESVDLWLLGTAAWGCACMAAMAFLRGNAAGASFVPASRYQDILALLALVNGLVLIRLLDSGATRPLTRGLVRGMVVTWVTVLAVGLVRLDRGLLRGALRDVQTLRAARMDALTAFLVTGSVRPMVATGIFPREQVLRDVLDDRLLTKRLPPELLGSLFRGPDDSGFAILRLVQGPAGSPAIHWASAPFMVNAPAVLVLAKDDQLRPDRGARLALLEVSGGQLRPMTPLGFKLGPWQEWAVRVEPGRYRMIVDFDQPGAMLDFLPPRPLSRVSYWTRAMLGWSPTILWMASALMVATVILVGWMAFAVRGTAQPGRPSGADAAP